MTWRAPSLFFHGVTRNTDVSDIQVFLTWKLDFRYVSWESDGELPPRFRPGHSDAQWRDPCANFRPGAGFGACQMPGE